MEAGVCCLRSIGHPECNLVTLMVSCDKSYVKTRELTLLACLMEVTRSCNDTMIDFFNFKSLSNGITKCVLSVVKVSTILNHR